MNCKAENYSAVLLAQVVSDQKIPKFIVSHMEAPRQDMWV
jgi:hypothetical protein